MNDNVHDVGVLVGSLRSQSYSRKLALALRATAPPGLRLRIIEIGAMSLYNADHEPQPAWLEFRREIKASDALLIVTPEYNRSIPSALKNAIDVGSRPKGGSAFDAKPAAVISVSPGALGAFGANHHLRQSLMCLNVAVMPAPEAYIGGIDKLFAEDGSIALESPRQFLDAFMRAFAQWIARLSTPAT